jgi:hypothetical protein
VAADIQMPYIVNLKTSFVLRGSPRSAQKLSGKDILLPIQTNVIRDTTAICRLMLCYRHNTPFLVTGALSGSP